MLWKYSKKFQFATDKVIPDSFFSIILTLAEMPILLNAFVYGDEATNLIQPLYVIPALALVNMKLKEVWGFMAFIWLIWFFVTSIGLLCIPRFF